MSFQKVKLAIVGLGRWAKVLTKAAKKSKILTIEAGYSRSENKRNDYSNEFGIYTTDTFEEILSNDEIKGVIITVPNEQHYTVSKQVAEAGKHVYTEKPISNLLSDGLKMAELQTTHDIIMIVGHSARLLSGIKIIKDAINNNKLGKLSFLESNFSNERALTLTPDTWRWYKDRAPGGPLSQLAIHQFDVLHYLGGEVDSVSSIASKLSPVGAEVDDQSMTTIKFKSGALGYVGSCWTSPGVFYVRAFGQKGLIHYELDFSSWDNPNDLHNTSNLYIQQGIDGFGLRKELEIPESNMFLEELEIFANSCLTGDVKQLSADNANIAVAMVFSALKSVDQNGKLISIKETIENAKK